MQYNPLSRFYREANFSGDPWIQSSSLGFTTQSRINERYLKTSELDSNNRSVTSQGTAVHRSIQRLLSAGNEIEGLEVPLSDMANRVYGNVDVMMKGGIPLEIKSVQTLKELRRLKRAKEENISQANFYAIASGSPYALVMYTARNDPSEFKTFRIPVDHQRYMADIQRIRHGISQLPGDPIRLNTASLNLRNTWAALTGPKGTGRLFHPWRGTAAQPYYQHEAVQPIGDYGTHMAANFREGSGGIVQYQRDNAIKHSLRSQHCRYAKPRVKYSTSSEPIRSRSSRSYANA